MVNEIIREVNQCLDNGCYMAALSLALTLPDICGKAKYPDMEKQTKHRYIKWFDEYIGQYEHDEEHIEKGMPYLSGELVYSLRCSVLHQGNPNIDGDKFGIIYFELLYHQYEGARINVSSSEAEIVLDENGKEKAINKKYSVNVRDLCFKLCRLAEYYYNKHKDQFNFFNYNFVDTDYKTRQIFGIKKVGGEDETK